MAESNGSPAPLSSASTFTDRELQMLSWAMQCLKSGPPEIDYEKLAGFAGMSNPRSASNAWAKIKAKLFQGAEGVATTPKTKGTLKKKVAAKTKDEADSNGDGDGEGEAETPKKTPRKRGTKKQEVDGEPGSPKKKGRPAKAKKTSDDEAVAVEGNTEIKEEAAETKGDSEPINEEEITEQI